jgi:molecular chaperone HscB
MCIHCGAESSGEHFCPGCGRILPIEPGGNYFEFLGVPKRLHLDDSELEKRFYSLSRQFHPDYFMSASDQERSASMERSSALNDAYRTLSNPITRAHYLLGLEGLKEAEKKAPPELLEEVFELNMEIEQIKAARELGDEDDLLQARESLQRATAGLNARLDEIDQKLRRAFDQWDTGHDRSMLEEINQMLSYRKYISNLVREIQEEI